MTMRRLRLVATAAVVLMVATLTMLTTNNTDRVQATTPYAGDVPIAWDDLGPPNFFACLVSTTIVATEATQMQTLLTPLAGYGKPGNLGTHIRVLRNQDGVPGTADDPTWTNIRNCITFLQNNAKAHDVAVLYLATHGMRGCIPPPPPPVIAVPFPWHLAADDGFIDESPDEPPGDEVNGVVVAAPAFLCPAPGGFGRRDGWFLTGIAPGNGVPADWIRDDQLAAALTGFRPDVGFVGIFATCFSGEHADGAGDTHDTLSADNIAHTLLLSVVREHVCTALGLPPTTTSEFGLRIFLGLAPVPNAACAGAPPVTRAADANGDCITTGVELFAFATAAPLANAADTKGHTGGQPPPNGAQPVIPAPNFGVWTTSKAIGGVAELPEVAGTPLETDGSSGASAGVLAGAIAGAVLVGGVSLGGAAWYARRRLSSR